MEGGGGGGSSPPLAGAGASSVNPDEAAIALAAISSFTVVDWLLMIKFLLFSSF